MRILELDAGGLRIEPPEFAPSGERTRTQSPAHVSNIIRDIENAIFKPGQRRPYDELSPSEQQRLGNYASVGWAWEEIIRAGILATGWHPPGDFISPGELSLDGIYGTPDWWRVRDDCLVEFKATWRSSRRPLDPDFWHWLVQIKAYCHMALTVRALLYVFYVNGDYRESGPELKLYELVSSGAELIDNWEMLKNHAKSKGWIE